MPTGLSVPLTVDELGRAVVLTGTEQLTKLLMIALQPCPSENPFQELGLSDRVIFAINSPGVQSRLRLNIESIFKTFQRAGRAKLLGVTFKINSAVQELEAIVSYQDMESTKNSELVLSLPRTGNVRARENRS